MLMRRLLSVFLIGSLFMTMNTEESAAQVSEENQSAPDTTLSNNFTWSVLPIVFSSPETSWAFGVLPQIVFNASGSERPSQVFLALFYTLNSQYGAFLNTDLWLNQDRDYLGVEAVVLHFPTLYYGIGSEELKSNPENYTEDLSGIRITGKHFFSKTLFGGITAATQKQRLTDIDEGGDIDQGLVPGSEGGRVLGIGPVIGYDSRNHNLFPSKGQLVDLRVVKYGGVLGGDYDYTQLVTPLSPDKLSTGWYLHFVVLGLPFLPVRVPLPRLFRKFRMDIFAGPRASASDSNCCPMLLSIFDLIWRSDQTRRNSISKLVRPSRNRRVVLISSRLPDQALNRT